MDCVPRANCRAIGLASLNIYQIKKLLQDVGLPKYGNRMQLSQRLVDSGLYYFDGEQICHISAPKTSTRGEISTQYDSSAYISPSKDCRSIIDCFPLHGILYTEEDFLSSEANKEFLNERRNSTLLRIDALGLVEGIRHPFPIGIGITDDGKPTLSLSEFTLSKRYPNALHYAMDILVNVSNTMDILRVLQVNIEGQLLCRVDFSLFARHEAKEMSHSLRKETLGFSEVIVPQQGQDEKIKIVRESVTDYNIVRIVTRIYNPKKNTGHMSQLHICVKEKKAFYLDSARYKGREYREWSKSLECFLSEQIGLEGIRVIPFEGESKTANIQEKAPTCAGWTLYLLLLSVINKELHTEDILRLLLSYDTYSRDLLLSSFYFYLEQIKDDIPPVILDRKSILQECINLPSFR